MMAVGYRALQSRSIQAGIGIGICGLGMTVSNLLFASRLSSEDFGRLLVFETILTVGTTFGALGLDDLAILRDLAPGALGQRLAAASGVLVGAVAIAAVLMFDLSWFAAGLMMTGCVAGAIARMCSAFEQVKGRFWHALLVIQSTNGTFAIATLGFSSVLPVRWETGATLFTLAYMTSGIIGLVASRKELMPGPALRADGRHQLRHFSWRPALVLAGIQASIILLWEVERLVALQVLTLPQLASFGVVSFVAGAPYRPLLYGTTFSLGPQLRAETVPAKRWTFFRNELRTMAALGLLIGAVIMVGAVPLIEVLYGAKYEVSHFLVGSLVFLGLTRLISGVAASAVVALASDIQLRMFNRLGWAGTALAFLTAIVLSGLGPAGVVLGAAVGWIVRLIVASVLLPGLFETASIPEAPQFPGPIAQPVPLPLGSRREV
jgi:hypothetical protein